MFLYTVVWVVDTGMVGRLGPDAVAAVGWAGQTTWVASAFFMGLAVATTSLVARAVGARRPGEAALWTRLSMLLAAGAGVATAGVFWAAAPTLFAITRLPPAVSGPGTTYIRIVALGNLVGVPLWVASAAHRGFGDTRTPLVGSIAVNIVNISLDYLLIFGHFGFPRLGVTGAALANIAGTMVSSAYVIGVLVLRRLPATPGPGRRIAWSDLRRLVVLGIPSGLENVAIDLARAVAGFAIAGLGTLSLAANELTTAAESISFMPGFGFAVAASVVAGQYVGANEHERGRERVRQGLHLALVFMGGVGLAFVLFPWPFVRLFTTDPELLRLSAQTLRVAGLSQVFVGITEIHAGALRGAGDTRTPLFITALGAWGVRIPLTLVLVYALKAPLPVVWLALLADWSLRSILLSRAYTRSPRFAPISARSPER